MSRIIVFVNQKGGVGKTTTALNLGAYMALAGKKVLLVDFDPQANMSSGLGISGKDKNVYKVLTGECTLDSCIRSSELLNLFVLPSSIDLSGATVELVDKEDRNYLLKELLEPVRAVYDMILIDCPPSLGVLTLNGLCAADEVIIPLQCEYFALEGLSMMLQTIKLVQKSFNRNLKISGIVFTMYDSRTKLAQDVVSQVTGYFEEKVYETIIPRNVRLSEAPSHGKPICLYDDSCLGAKSYAKLAKEVIARE